MSTVWLLAAIRMHEELVGTELAAGLGFSCGFFLFPGLEVVDNHPAVLNGGHKVNAAAEDDFLSAGQGSRRGGGLLSDVRCGALGLSKGPRVPALRVSAGSL